MHWALTLSLLASESNFPYLVLKSSFSQISGATWFRPAALPGWFVAFQSVSLNAPQSSSYLVLSIFAVLSELSAPGLGFHCMLYCVIVTGLLLNLGLLMYIFIGCFLSFFGKSILTWDLYMWTEISIFPAGCPFGDLEVLIILCKFANTLNVVWFLLFYSKDCFSWKMLLKK